MPELQARPSAIGAHAFSLGDGEALVRRQAFTAWPAQSGLRAALIRRRQFELARRGKRPQISRPADANKGMSAKTRIFAPGA
jgi:hypothetical protein